VPEDYQRVRQEHIDALCPELRSVVDDAVSLGNEVIETWTGFGSGVLLRRARPVLDGAPAQTRKKLVYRPINDPHYWLGELHCRDHPGWFVALPFEPRWQELPTLDVKVDKRAR
jgi:hypothetical protein